MGEEALVEDLSNEGSRLESRFRRMVPSTRSVAAIARDALTGEWQIVLPLPAGESRASAYKKVQRLILDFDLGLSMDKIVLIKADDPGLAELQGNLTIPGSRFASTQVPVEVGGRLFLDARPLRIGPQAFEQQVNQLLEDRFAEIAEIVYGRGVGRSSRSRWSSGERLHVESERRERLQLGVIPDLVDLLLIVGDSILLVEAKAYRTLLPSSAAMFSFGQLNYAQRVLARFSNVRMILVSATGFTRQVQSNFEIFEDFALVDWSGEDGERELLDTSYQFLNI